MNETRSNLGLGLLALGALALIAMVAFVALRARRRDVAQPSSILRRGS